MPRVFVQLTADGKRVHWRFTATERPVFAPYIVLVDVTDLDPQPEEGWLWDGEKFYPPGEPEPPKPQPDLDGLLLKVAAYLVGESTRDELVQKWNEITGLVKI